jgi:hypothetical protein
LISYFNKIELGELAWMVNASKSTESKRTETDGQA